MKTIAQWRRWTIHKHWTITTKRANSPNTKGAILKEIQLIQILNSAGITRVPQLIEKYNDGFSYIRIEWIHFEKAYTQADMSQRYHLAKWLLHRAYILDTLWVVHWELHRPTKNVLVSDNDEVCIIDFERGTMQEFSWKNMKAVGQWMAREGYVSIEVLKELGGKGLEEVYEILSQRLESAECWVQKYQFNNVSELCILISAFLSLDLLTKYIFYDLELLSATRLIEPILNLGSAWSLPVPHWITRLWAGALSVRLMYEYYKNNISYVVSGLIIAWAVWNSIDRILYGGVRDFIDITSFFSYPIFNLADCFLVIWCLLLIFQQIKYSKID